MMSILCRLDIHKMDIAAVFRLKKIIDKPMTAADINHTLNSPTVDRFGYTMKLPFDLVQCIFDDAFLP